MKTRENEVIHSKKSDQRQYTKTNDALWYKTVMHDTNDHVLEQRKIIIKKNRKIKLFLFHRINYKLLSFSKREESLQEIWSYFFAVCFLNL